MGRLTQKAQPKSQQKSTAPTSSKSVLNQGVEAPPITKMQRAAGNQAVQTMLQNREREAAKLALPNRVSGETAQGKMAGASAIPASLMSDETLCSSVKLRHSTWLPIRHKLKVSSPGDALEREADAAADRVVRMRVPTANPMQRKRSSSLSNNAGLNSGVGEQGGRPLSNGDRAYFEARFSHNFSAVRVHTGHEATSAAQAVQARAFTFGHDIVFGANEYAPSTVGGKRLLAHELAHVVQQKAGQSQGLVMREQAPQAAPVRQATVEEATEFLEDMTRFIEGARSFALSLVQPTLGVPATPAARSRAHGMLNQQGLRDMLTNALRVFAVQTSSLYQGTPISGGIVGLVAAMVMASMAQTQYRRLRLALLAVMSKIREAAPVALSISDGMPAPTPNNERNINAELVAELIEADPFTSTGLAQPFTPSGEEGRERLTFSSGAEEAAAGRAHEAFIEAYLDDLIQTLPGQTLAAADRDRIFERISAGLRRAFLTVSGGEHGTIDVSAISNSRIVEKYRRVVELLSAGMSARPPQLNIITSSLPAYVLPDPVPNVTAQLAANANIGAVDVSHIPSEEQPSVRYGVLQAANAVFPVGSTDSRRNTSWSVVLQVRRAAQVFRVRYDLIFDDTSNVRVERLGEAGPREVSPAFAQLDVAGKKAQLIADFSLAGVDDRPLAPGRPAAVWTASELDQVKAAYDLIPASDRSALQGVSLVRDHQGPPAAVAGQILMGFAHTGVSAAHDAPGPPAHGPPHIHYYDAAFDQNQVASVGAPGSTGPGGDWTLLHEVGHFRIFRAIRSGNAAIIAANALIVAANAGLPALNAALPPAQHQLRQAYAQARGTASAAIQAMNAAVIATPPATAAQRAVLLQAAQAAVVARDQARANLAAGGVPAAMVQAATDMDTAIDAVLAATQSLGVAQDQIPTFISLAGTFSFTPFTDYARRGGDSEFFAETYTLYLTDPNRLSAMNRNIFLWFEAGMPMNTGWRP